MRMITFFTGPFLLILLGFPSGTQAQLQISSGTPYLMNQARDISTDFSDFTNIFFFADELSSFHLKEGRGTVRWKRHKLETRQAFNTNTTVALPLQMLDFPFSAYENNPDFQFKLDFISPRTVRIRMQTSPVEADNKPSLMLAGNPGTDLSWQGTETAQSVTYTGLYGSICMEKHPWRLIVKDARGKILTQTRTLGDNDSSQVKSVPFCYIKRGSDNSRRVNPVFSLFPGEKIFGCGESFGPLNKAGQKLNLFVTDPQGPETGQMYKPVPFFMSSRGYGIFMHTSAPVTCDFGATNISETKLFLADESVDLFVFFGKPKEILNAYTDMVGKARMPPLWSFGTWMSRITYFSQEEGYSVAENLRKNKIPADVIHFDTGWFEKDWQCDYRFAPERFPDPQKMLDDLNKDGFRVCLWQLPYFTPGNRYFRELVEKGLVVKNANGSLPYEDAVLDFSNPETVKWYQDKLARLIRMGVSAIKVDFGEAAPLDGIYASGKSGLYEHNLYPLRYNKAVADITREIHGENVIWARSAWAGSQRYPLHWGGDAATTNMGMMGSLRGGLSFGLSGFSFWSHDIGGFVTSAPEGLYRRWLPFGFLSSHSRVHGAPPTEPWLYNEDFMKAFRQSAEMKYKLMPYVYAQAKACCESGLPMVRALFVEFPEDAGAWQVEDEYLFGSQMLVAPMLEGGLQREVYLPGGKWIDYQTGKVYKKGWHTIQTAAIPAVILVRNGSVLPHIGLASCTDEMDWSQIELKVYAAGTKQAAGLLCLPSDNRLHYLEVSVDTRGLKTDGLEGKVHFRISE
ncbi:MAG: TIM-barrel domain-containing protein [Mangrovibacterium sp.]